MDLSILLLVSAWVGFRLGLLNSAIASNSCASLLVDVPVFVCFRAESGSLGSEVWPLLIFCIFQIL